MLNKLHSDPDYSDPDYSLDFTDESGLDTEMYLQKLFQILDKKPSHRNSNLSDEPNAFPYVNSDLFKERIDIPSFTLS